MGLVYAGAIGAHLFLAKPVAKEKGHGGAAPTVTRHSTRVPTSVWPLVRLASLVDPAADVGALRPGRWCRDCAAGAQWSCGGADMEGTAHAVAMKGYQTRKSDD